jgi:hypothetical protein
MSEGEKRFSPTDPEMTGGSKGEMPPKGGEEFPNYLKILEEVDEYLGSLEEWREEMIKKGRASFEQTYDRLAERVGEEDLAELRASIDEGIGGLEESVEREYEESKRRLEEMRKGLVGLIEKFSSQN